MGVEKYIDAERPDDFTKTVLKTINACYQEVTITKVTGECPFGLREGERFNVTSMNHDGICGSLYQAIHPYIGSCHYGAEAPWEKKSGRWSSVCPEMGKVQVEVQRAAKEDIKVFKTRIKPRSMTGKGFPSLDKYRVFVEILGVERHCTWAHKAGDRFEVDSFNIGDLCGNLYWGAYRFINLLLGEGGLPWEGDKNFIHSMCPDVFNQTSYRLIKEER